MEHTSKERLVICLSFRCPANKTKRKLIPAPIKMINYTTTLQCISLALFDIGNACSIKLIDFHSSSIKL